jgi:hypothetical protein
MFPFPKEIGEPARPPVAASNRLDLSQLECPWCGGRPAEGGRGVWHGPVLEAVCRECGLVLRVFVGADPIELDELTDAVHPGFPND